MHLQPSALASMQLLFEDTETEPVTCTLHVRLALLLLKPGAL
jgi:hypothetical protein